MTKPNPRAKRGRSIRFTDAEWQELQQGAKAIGETRSEAIRAGAMSRVRQAIPDARDVTAALNRVVAGAFDARGPMPVHDVPGLRIFACAYCPAEFCTSFDTEAHIDAMHPQEAS